MRYSKPNPFPSSTLTGILAGFGAGGFFFSLIGSKIANPNGLNTAAGGGFPSAVYDNFPKMLRTLAGIYAVVSFIGSLLVFEPLAPSKPTTTASNAKPVAAAPLPGLTVGEAVKTSQFWLIWLMIISSATAGLNTAAVYKQFAATGPALAGDSFQSLVGGLGALFNGSGRLIWGALSDKIGFKKSFTLLTLVQITFLLLYSKSAVSKVSFDKHYLVVSIC
jgi:MFS transporter, OFA family, oxalate/formate antiporter